MERPAACSGRADHPAPQEAHSLAASIGASFVGLAAGNALGQGIDIASGAQDGFDLGDFAIDVGLSTVFGAIPIGKGGKGVADAASHGLAKGRSVR
ncbi:MAG: hypothetical protein R2748_30625 [Bryobacterales bacterium]